MLSELHKKRMCFVLMPFSKEFKNQWELAFIPAIEDANLKPWRGDEKSLGTNIIMSDVTRSISEAELIVADLTGKNPNVMYELGLAHAAKKPVILLAQDEKDIPFDIMHIRYLKYDIRDLSDLRTLLRDRINHTLAMGSDKYPDFFPELKLLHAQDMKELEYLRKRAIQIEVCTSPPIADIFFNDEFIGHAPQLIRVNPDAPNNSISAAYPEHFEFHRELGDEDYKSRKIVIKLEPRVRDELYKRVPRWLRLRQINPGNPVLMVAISFYLLSIGEYKDAIAEAKQLLQVYPGWYFAYNLYGYNLAAINNYEEAINYFKKVVALKPDSYLGYYNSACIYSLQGKYVECLSELKRIFQSESIRQSYCCLPSNTIVNDEDFDPIKANKHFAEEYKIIRDKFTKMYQEMSHSCHLLN